MTAKEGKVWGTTQTLINSPVVEVHRIIINKDGYCSQHTHQSKINAFYVISGDTLKLLNAYHLILEMITN